MTRHVVRVSIPPRTAADTGLANESGIQTAVKEATLQMHGEFLTKYPPGTVFIVTHDIEDGDDGQVLVLNARLKGDEDELAPAAD